MYTELSEGINHGSGNCVWCGRAIGIFTPSIIIQNAHSTSSLLRVLRHQLPRRERWFCPHFEGGEAGNPEIFSDSWKGTQQELSCNLGFLTLCPVRVPIFFYQGCFRCASCLK